MKKTLVVGVLVFTMAVGTFAAYASSEDTNFGFKRGYGNMMEEGVRFNRGIDLTEEERDEWIQEKREFFEKQLNLTEDERQEWFEEMQEQRIEYREERVKDALEDGTITEEQAAEYRAHFDEMNKLHEENGFMGGRMGKGGRSGNGMMGVSRFQ